MSGEVRRLDSDDAVAAAAQSLLGIVGQTLASFSFTWAGGQGLASGAAPASLNTHAVHVEGGRSDRPPVGSIIGHWFKCTKRCEEEPDEFYCLPSVVVAHDPDDATKFTTRTVFDDGPYTPEADRSATMTMAGMTANSDLYTSSESQDSEEWCYGYSNASPRVLVREVLNAAKTHCKLINFDKHESKNKVRGKLRVGASDVTFDIALEKKQKQDNSKKDVFYYMRTYMRTPRRSKKKQQKKQQKKEQHKAYVSSFCVNGNRIGGSRPSAKILEEAIAQLAPENPAE